VPIESFTVKNFRSFVDATEIQLRPLTLLFGYNSAGKSALLRTLPLLAASLRSPERAPIALACAAARQASFADLLPHPALSASRQLSFSLAFRLGPSGTLGPERVTWRIRDLPELRQQVVEEFDYAAADGSRLHALWQLTPSGPTRPGSQYEVHINGFLAGEMFISFQGLVPEFHEPTGTWRAPLDRLIDLFKVLRAERANVQWLSSVRRTPDRHLRWRNAAPSMLEPDGLGASDMLAYDDLAKGPLLGSVSAWYEKHLGWRLKVSHPADQYRLLMGPSSNSLVEVDVADVGEGLTQVLPVLVAAARLRDSSGNAPRILAVEEPESHLHPRLHAALTGSFCELAALPDPPQIILETHSENILLRVQLAVAEGQLSPEKVIVYWVRQSSDGRSRIDPVEFDSLGQPKGNNWPPGVFSEDLDQARKLLEAQRCQSRS